MELNEIRALLLDRNLKVVASGAGVDYQKLQRFSRGEVANPSWMLIRRLNDYFEQQTNRAA